MRVAVIGLGYWGPNFVRNLALLDSCSGVIACDIDEARLKTTHSLWPFVEVQTDYDEVLADPTIEAVIIATPVRTHAALATRALTAGKHVLVEKPLATSSADVKGLLDLGLSKSLVVMAGHTFLYSAPVVTIREMARSGGVGDPLYVQSTRVNLGIHRSDVSVLWDLAPHDLSILADWLDEAPVSVSATGRSTLADQPVDVAFLDVVFPSGVVANLHLSWLAPTKLRRMTMVGTRRMIVYEDTNPEEPVKVYDKGLDVPDPQDFGQYHLTYRTGDVVSPRVESVEPLRLELEDFLSRAQRSESPGPAEERAAAIVATIEAAERSLLTNAGWVDVDVDSEPAAANGKTDRAFIASGAGSAVPV